MIRHTRLSALVAIPATLLLATATFAQSNSASPSPSGSPSGSMGSSSGSSSGGASASGGGSGTLGSVDSTTTTTTTQIGGDDTSAPALDGSAGGAALPNTGGEPLMIAMLGSMAAMGAFALRRKLS